MKNKIIFAIMFLLIGASITYVADSILSEYVMYDNGKSGLNSTNVQEAIDELYSMSGNTCESASEPKSFLSDSWATIQKAVQTGNTNMYNVGDTKIVTIVEHSNGNETVAGQNATVRISNKTECTNGETSETACGFVIEFEGIIEKYNMNTTKTNVGGWRDSAMRSYLNSTIYSSLSSDLQNVIVDTKVISGHGATSGEENFETIDKLYLLATKEVYGSTNYDTLDTETRQLDYYKNKGVTLSKNYSGAIKKYDGSAIKYWHRSARSETITGFVSIFADGEQHNSGADAVYGVSPAFRIA